MFTNCVFFTDIDIDHITMVPYCTIQFYNGTTQQVVKTYYLRLKIMI